MPAPDDAPLLCARCLRTLTLGRGELYVVRIEAVADPSPPSYTAEDLAADPGAEIARLLDRLRDATARELDEQVARRLVLHLCIPCYRRWIEDPAGTTGG